MENKSFLKDENKVSSEEIGKKPRKYLDLFRYDCNMFIVVSHCFSSACRKLIANRGIHVAGRLLSLDALFSMVRYFWKARFNTVLK